MTRWLLLLPALATLGCAAEQAPAAVDPEAPEEAPAPWTLVVADPVSETAVLEALEAWNAALGREAIVLGDPATPYGARRHVYVRLAEDGSLAKGVGGLASCDGPTEVCIVRLRADLLKSARVIAHELGHVLGGWGHTETAGTLMYWESWYPHGAVGITPEDVVHVLAAR